MKIRSWIVVVLICILVAGGLGLFKFGQIRAAIAYAQSFPEPSETVEVFPAEEVSWTPTVSVVAETVPVRSVELRNELAGTIVEVGFEPGAAVAEAQLLLRLDTAEEEAELAAAEARAKLARLVLERNENLVQSSAVSRQAADTARAERDAAVATARRMRAIIAKKTLRAPFDAVAGLHEWQPGQYLDANTAVTRLVGVSGDIWIDFSLPQQQALLDVGDAVAIRGSGTAESALSAAIVAHNPYVDRASRNLRFRALADNRVARLPPGALVTVDVPIGSPREVIRVPSTAIRRDTFGTGVYVLEPAEGGADAPERAARRTVVVERIDDQVAYIRSGIEPGERVAANGAFKLHDGVLVNARVASMEPRGDSAQRK